MGLIRKSLHVATVGAVAPNSKKQRVQYQQLAALQGKSPEQVRRAGGRYEHSLGSLAGGADGYAVPQDEIARRHAAKVASDLAWHETWDREHGGVPSEVTLYLRQEQARISEGVTG